VRIRWFGQSAFLLSGEHTVFVDPFRIEESPEPGKKRFDYPPIRDVEADLLLVTHEHGDHNAIETVGGSPYLLRSVVGTFDTPFGEVVAVASEHDPVAGTRKGRNTIFCFELGGLRVAHLGDFGQSALRPEQQQAIGELDVLFVPVGGGAAIGGEAGVEIVRLVKPRLVIPMHYRTASVDAFDPPEPFFEALGASVECIGGNEIEAELYLGTHDRPGVVQLTPPG
jgi:L-ascorbate metabolism protein UlaG (beta-lactamase superfamily)